MRFKFIPVIFIIVFCACEPSKEERLKGTWLIANAQSDLGFEREEAQALTDEFFGNSFLNLLPTGEANMLFGTNYFQGQWKLSSDRSLIMLYNVGKNKKEDLVYSLHRVGSKDLVVTLRADSLIKTHILDLTMEFARDEFVYEDSTQDVHSIQNNRWRIRPDAPETPEQIRERVKSCVHYLIIHLNNTLKRKQNIISMAGVISPVKLASNGIALKKEDELSPEWINIFYDSAQAHDAHEVLSSGFNKHFKIQRKENWVALDYDLLKQLYRNIK